ncbi:MAG: hypothetical protein ACI89X_002095 [Planctomycetota bacterium]|jgi:hypothetical protein
MSHHELQERYLDQALVEVVGQKRMPDLAYAVASASAAERHAAVVRVANSSRSPSWLSHRKFAAAAMVMFGLAVLWGIWSGENDRNDVGEATDPPWHDEVQDPKRVIPKGREELAKLLAQVKSMTARGCYVTRYETGAPKRVNLDRGMGGFVPVKAKDHGTVLAELAKVTKRKLRPVRNGFDPGVRVILHLHDGRALHCLIEFSKTLRILSGDDFDIRSRHTLFNTLGGYCADSLEPTMQSLGIVQGHLDLRKPNGDYAFSSALESLTFQDAGDIDLMRHLARFTNLRSLDLTDSWQQLSSKAFQIAEWKPKARVAVAELRRFVGGRIDISDANGANLLGLMPKLKDLDLANCESIGRETVAVIAKLEALRNLDLSGCPAISYEDGLLLADHAGLVSVRLSQGNLSQAHKKHLETRFAEKLTWVK